MIGEAAQAVAEVYGLGSPNGAPVAAARGELGRIWQLDTDRGRWAVKELLDPTTDAAATEAVAKRDVAFQVAALEAGLPLPRPIVRGDGEVLDVHHGPRWRPRDLPRLCLGRPGQPTEPRMRRSSLRCWPVSIDSTLQPNGAVDRGSRAVGYEGLDLAAQEGARGKLPPWIAQFARLALAAREGRSDRRRGPTGRSPDGRSLRPVPPRLRPTEHPARHQ